MHAQRAVAVAAFVAQDSQPAARHAEDDVRVAVAVEVSGGEHARARERRSLFPINLRPDATRGLVAHVHPTVADVTPDVKLRMWVAAVHSEHSHKVEQAVVVVVYEL